ncbi:MAG: hypothetical protein HC936_18855 [Leptolyngbyaceae cyanobacterium SU_3_3]|nr:hypothetical protein [Leptolyngbyaceae cyanobacterium SU_3_3]
MRVSRLRFLRVAGVVLGAAVLVGWQFDILLLKTGLPGEAATTKANTAVCLLLSGVCLWQVQAERQAKRRRSQGDRLRSVHLLQPLFSVLYVLYSSAIVGIGLLTLLQYWLGWDLGIDQLLFQDQSDSTATSHPGRMGFNTALNFIFIGSSLFLIRSHDKQKVWLAQLLAAIAGLVAAQAMVGYAYDVRAFYQLSTLQHQWQFIRH